MAAATQFRGVSNVLEAYKANGVGPWAIWTGKIISFSSCEVGNQDVESGAEQLAPILKCLERGGSDGLFALTVYKLDTLDEDITAKTPIYRGFGFRLYEYAEDSPRSIVRRNNDETQAQLDELRDQMAKLAEAVLRKEEDNSIGGVIAGIISQVPGLKEAVAMGAAGLVRKVFKMDQTQPAAQVAGTPNQNPGHNLSAEQIQKVNQALEVLAKKDPLLGDHLLSLAQMPDAKYKMALTFL